MHSRLCEEALRRPDQYLARENLSTTFPLRIRDGTVRRVRL